MVKVVTQNGKQNRQNQMQKNIKHENIENTWFKPNI
jgi:hypothetical protein